MNLTTDLLDHKILGGGKRLQQFNGARNNRFDFGRDPDNRLELCLLAGRTTVVSGAGLPAAD
jgi:hypothetical protein